MILYHATPSFNVDSIQKDGLQPRIGERSLSAGEKTPAVFLFANQDDLEQALLNWLGEMFEDEDLVILEIQLPLEYKQFLAQSEYEITCSVAIPPQYIRLYEKIYSFECEKSERFNRISRSSHLFAVAGTRCSSGQPLSFMTERTISSG